MPPSGRDHRLRTQRSRDARFGRQESERCWLRSALGRSLADGCGETLSNLLALAGGVTGPRAKCKSAAVRIRARRQAKSPGAPFGDGPDRIPRREPGRGVRARRPPAPGRMRSSRSSDRTTFVDRRGNYAVGSWLSTNNGSELTRKPRRMSGSIVTCEMTSGRGATRRTRSGNGFCPRQNLTKVNLLPTQSPWMLDSVPTRRASPQ